MTVRTLISLGALVLTCACNAGPNPNETAERNKALIRQFARDIDRMPNLNEVDKWMTADYTARANGGPPMNLEAHKVGIAQMRKAFSDLTHEIREIVAEGDRVAATMTVRGTHTGDYAGLSPTGKQITLEEAVFFQVRDGKIASALVFVDAAVVQQQLMAAAKK